MEDYAAYTPWIVMAVNGLIAGWLAHLILGGGGLIRDIFTGIIGAFVGGALVQAGLLKLPILLDWPWAHQILVATIGALLIIIIARIIGR
jgi:uncharacterized membrane protein YeaQ/YmgE (transglycosylase-associated protein family)